MISRILISTLLSASLIASPALADRDDHRDRHDRDWRHDRDHHSWNRYGSWYRPRTTVIYRTSPRPPVDYVYMSNYNTPSYRQIRCTNDYNPLGMLLGGAAGGVLGHQIGKGKGNTAATIGGALIGAGIGGNSFSQRCSETVFQQTPLGTPITWQDDYSQQYYQVTPTKEYRTAGRYCREYQARATVGGRTQDTYGTACMQPDGSWEVVN